MDVYSCSRALVRQAKRLCNTDVRLRNLAHNIIQFDNTCKWWPQRKEPSGFVCMQRQAIDACAFVAERRSLVVLLLLLLALSRCTMLSAASTVTTTQLLAATSSAVCLQNHNKQSSFLCPLKTVGTGCCSCFVACFLDAWRTPTHAAAQQRRQDDLLVLSLCFLSLPLARTMNQLSL
jgi:hypothetical protein